MVDSKENYKFDLRVKGLMCNSGVTLQGEIKYWLLRGVGRLMYPIAKMTLILVNVVLYPINIKF